MKIGSYDKTHQTGLNPPASDKPAAAAKGAAKPAAEASAQVKLSSTASALNENSAEFDTAKVDRIAQAIRDGKFKVNAEAIADKLIGNAQELLGRSH